MSHIVPAPILGLTRPAPSPHGVTVRGGCLFPAGDESAPVISAVAPSTLLDGLGGYWKLDGNGADALGLNPLVQNVAPPSYVPGKIGQAAQFNGSNGLIVASPTAGIKGVNAFSVVTWIYATLPWANTVAARALADWHQSSAADRWLFYSGAGFGLQWYVCTLNGVAVSAIPFGMPTINAWHMYVGTADANGMAAYLDGVITGSHAWGSPVTYNPSVGLPVSLGMQYNVLGGFPGILDETCIYNRVLTPAEITELYNGGAGKSYPFT